jgi:hypothetical protein
VAINCFLTDIWTMQLIVSMSVTTRQLRFIERIRSIKPSHPACENQTCLTRTVRDGHFLHCDSTSSVFLTQAQVKTPLSRVIAHAVSRRPLIVEACVRARSMWDLWWTKWHWDRFLSELFGFLLLISLLRECPYSYIIWKAVQRHRLTPST